MKKKLFPRNIRLTFDKSFSSGQTKQILWLLGFMVLVFALLSSLSYIKFLYTPNIDDEAHWYDRYRDILLILIDPGSGSESMSSTFTVVCALFGLIIFSGMLISVISNILERRVESYINGETDYNIKDHIVVVGFNQSVPSLLKKIHDDHKDSYILLMSSQDSETIRDWIRSNLNDDIEKVLIVIKGVHTTTDDIRRLNLNNNVKEIYILGEEGDLNHDSNNLKCATLIDNFINDNNVKIHCYVQINSDTTYSVVQQIEFSTAKLIFEPFNINEIWSQKIIATDPDSSFITYKGEKIKYTPLDGNGITASSGKHVHLIIIGCNELSSSIAVNAAHVLHFPNFKDGDFDTCSHITFIDHDISCFSKLFRSQYRNLFELCRWREIEGSDSQDKDKGWINPFESEVSQYKHLGDTNFLDIQWEFISGDVYDKYIQEYLKECSANDSEITTIALCSESSELNASVCLALPNEICRTSNQILVRQIENSTTIELIQELSYRKNGLKNIKPFGMMYECYEESLISDKYGKLTNAVYDGIDLSNEDEINEAWAKKKPMEKWSSIYNANMLYYRLRSFGLTLDNLTQDDVKLKIQEHLTLGAETEHNRWNTEKLLLGFAPLTKDEQGKVLTGDEWGYDDKKRKGICHRDICSNQRLDEIHKPSREWDKLLINHLWELHYTRIKNN